MRSPKDPGAAVRYCGRLFSLDELQGIRRLLADPPALNRAQLSRRVCEGIGWVTPDGRLKEMSCRVALLRMERDGRIVLPAPLKRNGNGRRRPELTSASDPQPPLSLSARDLGAPALRPVLSRRDSVLWNELIERYHYLGYKPLPGAQIRYLVFAGSRLLGALGFSAAAWKAAPRDHFIGWTPERRAQTLHLVVNNARFLILPWVTVKNLASRILGQAARQLPSDWEGRYGYRPLLLETFVEKQRFHGTCYRAANWIAVGQTKGRGKLDRHWRFPVPVKEVFLYPLHSRFRPLLCGQ